MERIGTGIGSLHFAIGSHRGVDVEVLVGTFGMDAGFTSPHPFHPAGLDMLSLCGTSRLLWTFR